MKATLSIVVLALAGSALGSAVPGPRCPADRDVFLPAADCGDYIVCANGNPIEMSCPAGLKFNLEILSCDWPENVDCNNRFPFVPPFEQLPNGCPVDFNINWLLPDKENCNKFIYCVDGEYVKTSCPATLHFNYKEQVCDYPDNAGCKKW